MKHTSNLRNYIYQKEFKITIKKNMIDIENFTNIGKIENYEIVIYNNKEKNELNYMKDYFNIGINNIRINILNDEELKKIGYKN